MNVRFGMTSAQIKSDTQKSLHVDVFDSFEQLQSRQEEWDKFVESVGSEIFLTYDWCRIWWKYYGTKRRLRVFVFRRDGVIVGIIPLFIDNIRIGLLSVRAAKLVGSDSTLAQFSLPIADAYFADVLERFYESLKDEKWDVLFIGPVAGKYDKYDSLWQISQKLLGDSYAVLHESSDMQTYFKLAGTWDEYLESLDRKERNKIRRHYRLAQKAAKHKGDTIWNESATADNFEQMFEGFVQMHQEHWKRLNRLGHFGDWHYAHEYHRELAETQLKRNRLSLSRTMLGDCCIGYKYGYVFGDYYCDFLSARSDSDKLGSVGLGRIIYGEMVKSVLQANVKYIDSMRGEYKHKLEMGGELLSRKSIFIFPLNSSNALRIRMFRALARILHLCYYRIWFLKLAPKMPLRRKPLWELWIKTCGFVGHIK